MLWLDLLSIGFFQNEVIFVQLDELDELGRTTHVSRDGPFSQLTFLHP